MAASSKPMSVGAIFAIIMLTGLVVGALLGIARQKFGGSVWLAGAIAEA